MIRLLKIVAFFFAFILIGGLSAYLTLSFVVESEPSVVVPELLGKDVADVLELLTKMGLNAKVQGFEYNSGVPKNHIIYQNPQAGTEIKKGRDIRLVLSKGSELVIMPDLKGLDFQKAGIILQENDLCLKNIAEITTKSIRPGEVLGQFPPSGDHVFREDCADLLVSGGVRSQAFKMPSFVEFSLDQAILAAEDYRLTIGNISSVHRKNYPLNVVLNQEPMGGYRVWPGTAVDLVINRKPGTKKENGMVRPLGIGLLNYRTECGFLNRHIEVRLNAYGHQLEIINDYVGPGENIWVLVPQNRDATVFVFEDDRLAKTLSF